ncbi:unnamed protein product [Moneuplotes crassus]|uniref:Ion transport domain-containing protein n=1 Tax=Euplotes crassus TaxID=5936 RepID=A0AAD1TZL5_EUPCR|nr:unnamed protein product [Moneuplotes crassus]
MVTRFALNITFQFTWIERETSELLFRAFLFYDLGFKHSNCSLSQSSPIGLPCISFSCIFYQTSWIKGYFRMKSNKRKPLTFVNKDPEYLTRDRKFSEDFNHKNLFEEFVDGKVHGLNNSNDLTSKHKLLRSTLKCFLGYQSEDVDLALDDLDNLDDLSNWRECTLDPEVVQEIIETCLHMKSFKCTEVIIRGLLKRKIDPVVGIKSISEVIQGCESEAVQKIPQVKNQNCKSSFSKAKSMKLKFRETEEHRRDCSKILQLLLESKSCILKYGDQHEDISDILRCCYTKIWDSTIKRNSEEGSNPHEVDEEFCSYSKINEESIIDLNNDFSSHHEFVKIAPKINKDMINKIDTLRIEKIKQIMANKFQAKGVKMFDLHLLNMKNSSTKYLHHKDVIEIALIFCLFSGSQIVDLCKLIFTWDNSLDSRLSYLYPLSVYKLLIFYEELEGFDLLYQQETSEDTKDNIIAESLSYSLIINNPLIAVYLSNNYPQEVFDNKNIIIDSILNYLNEFTELNGGLRYKRITNLEQYLFLVERMIHFFSFAQSKYFISIMDGLIEVGKIDTSKLWVPMKDRHNSEEARFDRFENNFATYSLSPVKDCILVMFICSKLGDIHNETRHINQDVIQKYSGLVNELLDGVEDMNKVYSILTCKCFNKMEVINIISQRSFQTVLNNSKVVRIVNDFWEGPFETEFFMSNSFAYQKIRMLFTGSRRFLGYRPENNYEFSIENLWKKSPKKRAIKKSHFKKAHFFHFERWNESLFTKYFIECLFVTLVCGFTYWIVSDSLVYSKNLYSHYASIESLEAQLSSPTLTVTQRASLEADLLQKKDEYEVFSKEIMSLMILWVRVNTSFLLYLFKNIMEIICVKLRSMDASFLLPDLVMSLTNSLMIARAAIILNYFSLQRYDKSDKYYYTKTFQYLNDNYVGFGLEETFVVVLIIQCIRVLAILRASKTLGPMIEIVCHMLWEVMVFIVIEFCVITLFAGAFRILFSEIEEFTDDTQAILTLISASMSNFEFDIFNDEEIRVSKYYGYVLMLAFILISGVTLLNFLIAVITHVYERLSKIAQGLYLQNLIEIRQVLVNDNKFSCLVSTVPPFNIVSVLLSPIIIYFESANLNKVILYFEFSLVVLLAIIFYAMFAIISIPLAFIVTLMQLLRDFCEMSRRNRSKLVVLIDFAIFCVFGIFILTVRTLFDMVEFVTDLFTKNLVRKNQAGTTKKGVPVTDEAMDSNFYRFFIAFLENYQVNDIASNVLISDLRETLEISHQIKQIIFFGHDVETMNPRIKTFKNTENPKEALFKDSDDCLNILKQEILASYSPKHILAQYNIIKRVINKCSIPNKLKSNFSQTISNFKAQEVTDLMKEKIFYIKEFLSMMREIQEKSIFSQMIYTNIFEDQLIQRLTKSGSKQHSSLLKSSKSTNLLLLHKKHLGLTPDKETLSSLLVSSNYACISKFHS